MSTRSTPVPNHTALWPPLENSAAPAVTASEMVAPALKAEPASRIGGRGVGANPARRGGGTGGGSAVEEERLNAIVYNNVYVEGGGAFSGTQGR